MEDAVLSAQSNDRIRQRVAAPDRSHCCRALQGHSAPDQIEMRSTLLASMENDFGLLAAFNPKLRAAAVGPKTQIQQRDQFVYEEAMRGERYSSISLRLPELCAAQGWPDEGDNTAIRCREIAANYASANGLPAPDPRQIS